MTQDNSIVPVGIKKNNQGVDCLLPLDPTTDYFSKNYMPSTIASNKGFLVFNKFTGTLTNNSTLQLSKFTSIKNNLLVVNDIINPLKPSTFYAIEGILNFTLTGGLGINAAVTVTCSATNSSFNNTDSSNVVIDTYNSNNTGASFCIF